MISLTVRRKIMGIAVVLIVLMAVTAALSLASVIQVGDQLDDIGDAIMAYWGPPFADHAAQAIALIN